MSPRKDSFTPMAGRGRPPCYRINVGFEPAEGRLPWGPARRFWERLCLARKRTAAGPRPADAGETRSIRQDAPFPSHPRAGPGDCHPGRSGSRRRPPVYRATAPPPNPPVSPHPARCPADLLGRPAAPPTRDAASASPFRPRHHSGATPSAAKGLREAHRAGSGGHGVEPGPVPMPARGPTSRLPPQGLQLLDRRLGFRGDFAGRDDTGTRQRGVLRVAGRRGRRVVLEADRGLETSG